MFKSFNDFLVEAEKKLSPRLSPELTSRNDVIDIHNLVRSSVQSKFPHAPDEACKEISDHMSTRKTFSLGKMSDELPHPAGWMKHAIDTVKSEAAKHGLSKAGGVSKTQTQADRIDTYLKQKHVRR